MNREKCFGRPMVHLACYTCKERIECCEDYTKNKQQKEEEDDIKDIVKKIKEYEEEQEKKYEEFISKKVRISKKDYYLGIAFAVSKRSNCLKRHYGCIIVKNDEIIATGYNGSPRGMDNCCDYGKCERLNIPHNSGDYSDCPSVHAEQNAMLSASRKDMIGATMYLAGEDLTETNWHNDENSEIINAEPCPICARMIANSGITKIINKKGEVNLRSLL